MGKVWKNGGEEDKFIKKLNHKGKITKFTKPLKIKTEYPHIFGGDFTMNVIRNHLNLLKLSNGMYLDGESDDEIVEVEDKQEETLNVEGERSTARTLDNIVSGFENIFHCNYPVICEMYKDPENGCEKVALVVTLPAGSENVTVEISDDGASATVKYNWSKTIYDMRDLYNKMLAARQVNIHHPRVLCIKNALEKYRKRIDTAPEAAIKVVFPIRVQTTGDSWSQSGVTKDDGTQILMGDFTGFVKTYIAKVRVKFE